jgi:hypothetical protein
MPQLHASTAGRMDTVLGAQRYRLGNVSGSANGETKILVGYRRNNLGTQTTRRCDPMQLTGVNHI